jgi:hypothetical protein
MNRIFCMFKFRTTTIYNAEGFYQLALLFARTNTNSKIL